MIIVAGSITVPPERRAEALAGTVEIMTASRAEEGCLDYVFSADPLNDDTIKLFELWESADALDAHKELPHYLKFQGEIGTFGVTGIDINRYEIASVGPL